MARSMLKDVPIEIFCSFCNKTIKAKSHTRSKYRKGQRTFYCDIKYRILASQTICIADGCDKSAKGRKYCVRHYKQMYRHGKILERTRFDLNEFIEDGSICRIYLYNKNGQKCAETIVDIEDMEKCKTKKWRLTNGYVCSGEKIYLHNFILDRETNMQEIMDHRDHNKLNNRKSNIRVCNKSQNAANLIKKNTRFSSLFKGVYWRKSRKRWCAKIMKNYKSIYLGSFKKEIDAALAYNEAAKRIFGDFAYLNKI